MNIVQAPAKFLSPDLLARFIAIVGDKNAITDPQAQAPYLVEMRDLYHGHTPVVLRPGSVAEVAEILKLANETVDRRSCRRAATPAWSAGRSPHNGEVVLSLNRMDKIREVDPVSNTMTCEAGVTLQRAREAAAAGRPALSAAAAVGGQLHHRRQSLDQCRRHRRARLWHRALACARPRSRAGRRPRAQQPQQAQEGQHRLRPARTCSSAPKARSASSPPRCCGWCRGRARSRPPSSACPRRRRRSTCSGLRPSAPRGGVTSFEMMPRDRASSSWSSTAPGCRDPLPETAPLVRADRTVVAARATGLREAMEEILADGPGARPRRTTPRSPRASSRPRRSGASASCSARCSGTKAARSSTTSRCRSPAVPAFIEEANAAVDQAHSRLPAAAVRPLGDGNIHYNVTQPVGADKAEFLKRWDEVNDVVFDVVREARRLDLGRARHRRRSSATSCRR